MDETLRSNIEQAAKEFKARNIKKALMKYEQCISVASRIKDSKYRTLILNLYGTKAALQLLLERQGEAQDTLEIALNDDPYNIELLMRRSQLYAKKKNYQDAIKDLDMIAIFSPDNPQIYARKDQLQGLKSKEENQEDLGQQQNQQEVDLDEEASLQFIKLKMIDRASVDLSNSPFKSLNKRESRVTISGDNAFIYEKYDDDKQDQQTTGKSQGKALSVQDNLQRAEQVDQELSRELNEEDCEQLIAPKIKHETSKQTKSILKNRDSIINFDKEIKIPVIETRKRKASLLQKIKDIDGKVIRPDLPGEEVGFRKSISYSVAPQFPLSPQIKKHLSTCSRKSILKQPSINNNQDIPIPSNSKPVRKSKFEMLSKDSIDGGMIRHRGQNNKQDSDSDEGSSHNIFGSQFALSNEVKQKLGLNAESPSPSDQPQTRKLKGAKSILKKMSIFAPTVQQPRHRLSFSNAGKKVSTVQKEPQQLSKSQNEAQKISPQRKLKSKRSVMFQSEPA